MSPEATESAQKPMQMMSSICPMIDSAQRTAGVVTVVHAF
ncbi:hypothetical protein L915_21897 [Phytophthora nicotianae]|uniref:Uncharacterized protein n=1 Tax=Phytophthora nicotianae TaxID=4792 RepID=W2N9A8_PHYNI|nr:hypothetical protein L915_21897 [Phytophthora nicotianae]ETM44483.1 hypothetical protein L914_10291 [Phytophthora nicotianae]